jgi:hypothetical protein
MRVELAVEGAVDRLANTPRQVDVRRVDHDSPRILPNAHNAVQRMLVLLDFFLVAR